MNHIKVMLVDDEILAIDYLKNLINWEEWGYKIIATATSGKKAMELLKKTEPDLLIADIKMPGMDGLELSERVLSVNPNTKIILLTSYRDFEYAKKALVIGITNYLLKHELKPENLIQELNKIKNEFNQEQKKEDMIRKQLLKNLLEKKNFSYIDSDTLSQYFMGNDKCFQLFLLVFDLPYEIFKTGFTPEYPNIGNGEWSDMKQDYNIKYLVPVPVKEGIWIMLASFDKVYSQRDILDRTSAIGYGLQRYIKENFSKTVCIIYSKVFRDILNIKDVYEEIENIPPILIFTGRGRLITAQQTMQKKYIGEEKMQNVLGEIFEEMEYHNQESVVSKIDLLFSTIIRGHDIDAFRKVSRELFDFLEYFRNKNGLLPYKEIYEKNKKMVENWYSVSDIHQWFIDRFRETLAEVINMKSKNCSKKIRETVRYIAEHYNENLRIEELAQIMEISGDYLRHVFKSEMGITIIEYLTEVRIERAKNLLLGQKYKIYQIAEMVGYNSSSYFNQTFKKYTGKSPMDFVEEVKPE